MFAMFAMFSYFETRNKTKIGRMKNEVEIVKNFYQISY